MEITIYYVTVVLLPKGATPERTNIETLPRTDIAKFFAAEDARSYAAKYVTGPNYYDARIEPRLEQAEPEVDADPYPGRRGAALPMRP